MHDILLAIQYFSIAGVFIESLIVIRNMRTHLHIYLFVSCLTSLINDIGYYLQMTSQTRDSYITALQFSYTGRVWFGLFMFLFVAELVRIRIPSLIKYTLEFFHLATYIVILTIRSHKLYYTSPMFGTGGMFPHLSHGNGIVHHLFVALQIIYILIALFWLIRALTRATRKSDRKRFATVLIAVIVEALFFALQIIGLGDITYEYDITMLGYFIGNLIMLLAILRFDLLGTVEIARDFVVDRLAAGILATDTNGIVQYFNKPMQDIYPEITIQPEIPLNIIKNAIENKATIAKNNRIYRSEKNDLLYEGESIGTLYGLVDETEHYQYMEELEKQKTIADNANRAKSNFLARMSHEIRTPINAVLGMDEMILRESREADTKAYAADIQSAGKTLLSLINDILDLSKIEEGKMEILPVQYELSSLIHDMVNMVRDRAQKKGLSFNVQVDENTPYLLTGDEIRIRQCATNLLTNAVKYTEEGSVTLTVSYEKKDDEHIVLCIRVSDTGQGIRDEDREKLFASFTRIEEKRNRTIEGTGLGMNITVQLLQLMGSQLEVESEYGRGSTFSFAVEQEVVEWNPVGDYTGRFDRSETVYRELFHAPDAGILVVDDTEVNLSVIQNLLKRTQIHIDTALSGHEALALADENSYDVIFIDHMMPDMDGIETCRRLKDSQKNKETPTVALTANAISGAREMYLEAGFTTYMSKPVDGEKLEKLLNNLLPSDKIERQMTDSADRDTGAPDENSAMSETGRSTSETGQNPGNSVPSWLYQIPEMDVSQGIHNGGSPEGYLSILTVFYETAEAKADEIEQLYSDHEIKDYTIKVHALKSSARIIGAMELSELAKQLEDAGEQGNTDFMESRTPELLDRFRRLGQALAPLKPEREQRAEIDESRLREAFQTMQEIAGSMDYGLMDELIRQVRTYELSTADEERLDQIAEALSKLDWETILRITQERMNEKG